jgi:plasmid stabilization system protein ParE
VKVEYHPLFQTDLDKAALYYLKEGGKVLAERFIDEVEQGIFRIEHNPLSCSKEFREVRRLRLKHFKVYAIRYSFDENTETIFIGNLVHGARHPDTGKDRFR